MGGNLEQLQVDRIGSYRRRYRYGTPQHRFCCKECQSSTYKNSTTERKLFHAAKRRAVLKGLEFNLKVEDIKIPDLCPMLGIPLFPATGKHAKDNSPTIDRVDSSLGYIPNNILVISHRANTIKGNATIEELEMIADCIESFLADPEGH